MSLLTEPIVVGIAIALPSTGLGWLGYVRARNVDRATEQAGIVTGRSTELNLALAGMSSLADNLQEDNRSLREEVARLSQRLNVVVAECDELAKLLRHFRQKYGENGDSAPK